MTDFSKLNHPLGLRHLPSTYADFTALAYTRFADPGTLVFVDTNILGLPFRFHEEARSGFFSLLNIAIGQRRLYVPGWASNEFFHNAFRRGPNGGHGFTLGADTVRRLPGREQVLGILNKLASDKAIGKVARLLDVDKHQALATIADIGADWNEAVSNIGADLNADEIHGELVEKFGGCFLPLDFNRHSALLEEHADRRRANRLPPGLTDGGKGDKEKRGQNAGNVDGDLALWLEILERAKGLQPDAAGGGAPESYRCVIVLTEERKEDFCYAPRYRLPEPGSRKPGHANNDTPRILLPDPRLVSEFEQRVGHRNIAFLNVETLAHGWQSIHGAATGGDDIRAFARALMQQIESDVATPAMAAAEVAEVPGESVPDAQAGAAHAPADAGAQEQPGLDIPVRAARNEKKYTEEIADLPGMDMVTALNTTNWYVQNPAVQELLKRGIPTHLGVAFLLGRSLFSAAHGNAWRADTYIKRFEETASDGGDHQQALLAGLAYEALFDGDGMRRLDPKSRNLHHVLGMLCKDKWARAREWVQAQMRAAGPWYWRPCTPAPELTVLLEGARQDGYFEVAQITIKADGERDLALLAQRHDADPAPDPMTLDELIEWIADHALVPADRVIVRTVTSERLRIREGLTFSLVAFRQL